MVTYRILALLILLALVACATTRPSPCTGYVQYTDAWCECMWAADSTYFTKGR